MPFYLMLSRQGVFPVRKTIFGTDFRFGPGGIPVRMILGTEFTAPERRIILGRSSQPCSTNAWFLNRASFSNTTPLDLHAGSGHNTDSVSRVLRYRSASSHIVPFRVNRFHRGTLVLSFYNLWRGQGIGYPIRTRHRGVGTIAIGDDGVRRRRDLDPEVVWSLVVRSLVALAVIFSLSGRFCI